MQLVFTPAVVWSSSAKAAKALGGIRYELSRQYQTARIGEEPHVGVVAIGDPSVQVHTTVSA